MLCVLILSLNFVSYPLTIFTFWLRVQSMLRSWSQSKLLQFLVCSLPSDTYFQLQRVWDLKEINFQNYSLPLTLITNLERKWIQQMYASDFHPWQQRQSNYQNLQRSQAEIQKHWQELHQLYHRKQFTILCVLQFHRKHKLINLVVKLWKKRNQFWVVLLLVLFVRLWINLWVVLVN